MHAVYSAAGVHGLQGGERLMQGGEERCFMDLGLWGGLLEPLLLTRGVQGSRPEPWEAAVERGSRGAAPKRS